MSYPLVIIGAGPIGLAAAAHAAERGLDVVVLESGSGAGAAVGDWSHVRLFSAWRELVDPAARRLLEGAGTWIAPEQDGYPTGGEWRDDYLQPLADLLDRHPLGTVRYESRVVGVARDGRDLLVDAGRDDAAFAVHVETTSGSERLLADSVIDASGTWRTPNPLGADGYPAPGEREHADRISYGIPDLRDPAVAARYAGKHVAVAGKGASAQGVLVGLARLAQEAGPGTRVSWLLRRPDVGDAFGGGDDDQLEQRGRLGQDARAAASSGVVTHVTRFRTAAVTSGEDGRLTLTSVDGQRVEDVDEVVVVTGFRPDLGFLSEVRLDLDPALGAARILADQIHPDHHSCGDVAPHGHRELAQPEQGLYVVGMKSYGRAPSFLAMTGFEQVRSVVAALAGDLEAAGRVDLVLPDTGVCNGAGAFDSPGAVVASAGAVELLGGRERVEPWEVAQHPEHDDEGEQGPDRPARQARGARRGSPEEAQRPGDERDQQVGRREDRQRVAGERAGDVAVEQVVGGAERAAAGAPEPGRRQERAGRVVTGLVGVDGRQHQGGGDARQGHPGDGQHPAPPHTWSGGGGSGVPVEDGVVHGVDQ